MDDKRLKQVLTARAERDIPASLDMRRSIYGRIQLKPTPQRRIRLSPAAIITLVILAFASAAFAYYQTVIRPDQGISAVSADNLVVQIGSSQSIPTSSDDLKNLDVTLDYAYADSNRIVVGYHVSGQAKAGLNPQFYMNPHLSDTANHDFPWLPAGGQQASPENDTADFRTDGIMSFDSAVLQNAPSSLDLSLRIEVAYSTADNPNGIVFAGKTSFEFSLPFNPGRTTSLDQSVTAGGITLNVKKMVVAPSLTRLEFCATDTPFVSTPEHWLDWKASVTVAVNGQQVANTSEASFSALPGQPLEPDAPCRALVIPDSLVQHTGNWVLTINAFDNDGSDEHLAGSWTFNINVGN